MGGALIGREGGRVGCDGRLTHLVVVELCEGFEIRLRALPDLHL